MPVQPLLIQPKATSERKRKASDSEDADDQAQAKRKQLIAFTKAEKDAFVREIFNPHLKAFLGPFVPKNKAPVHEALRAFLLDGPQGIRNLSPIEVLFLYFPSHVSFNLHLLGRDGISSLSRFPIQVA